MNQQCFSEKSVLLTDITPMFMEQLSGDEKIPFEERASGKCH